MLSFDIYSDEKITQKWANWGNGNIDQDNYWLYFHTDIRVERTFNTKNSGWQ